MGVGCYFEKILRGLFGVGKCVKAYQKDALVQFIFTHTAIPSSLSSMSCQSCMCSSHSHRHKSRAGHGHCCSGPPQGFDRHDELRPMPSCPSERVGVLRLRVFSIFHSFRAKHAHARTVQLIGHKNIACARLTLDQLRADLSYGANNHLLSAALLVWPSKHQNHLLHGGAKLVGARNPTAVSRCSKRLEAMQNMTAEKRA